MRALRARAVLPFLAMVLCAGLWSGCARRWVERPAEDGRGATIAFNNESSNRAEVFVVERSGPMTRLGLVTAGRTEVMDIPPYVVARGASVVIGARVRIRSRLLTTGDLVIRPGEQLQVHLPADERMLVLLSVRE
jgi:hypothetical protein